MKSEQQIYSLAQGWKKKSDSNLSSTANLVLLFGNREILKQEKPILEIRSQYPNAEVVGCSTSGDFCGNEIYENHIVATAVWFEKTKIKILTEEINNMDESFDIGEKLANRFDKTRLVHVMVLSEGLNINGSHLTAGLNKGFENKVTITGGLAGDENKFEETVIIYNSPGVRNKILAIGFYGEHIKIGYGSIGGWTSFGVDREITRSKGNILFELDGQPALQLYKRYLGDYASSLPASGLLFPLSLKLRDKDTSLVRTVLAVNEEAGSMTFAGDVPQGEYVRLMQSNSEKLIEGAACAAELSLSHLGQEQPDLAILISCLGRKLVLKQRADEEPDIIQETFGLGTTLAGFHSYGEICPIGEGFLSCELHNQTMTITAFKEY